MGRKWRLTLPQRFAALGATMVFGLVLSRTVVAPGRSDVPPTPTTAGQAWSRFAVALNRVERGVSGATDQAAGLLLPSACASLSTGITYPDGSRVTCADAVGERFSSVRRRYPVQLRGIVVRQRVAVGCAGRHLVRVVLHRQWMVERFAASTRCG